MHSFCDADDSFGPNKRSILAAGQSCESFDAHAVKSKSVSNAHLKNVALESIGHNYLEDRVALARWRRYVGGSRGL